MERQKVASTPKEVAATEAATGQQMPTPPKKKLFGLREPDGIFAKNREELFSRAHLHKKTAKDWKQKFKFNSSDQPEQDIEDGGYMFL
eukprot:CAMPEP_0172598758 /NCGR_PEP_ID=MMETSP1068-20121228/18826_1 /TAXON_ID=35684 /ORGANISM="Pseudopedinella elastica, Strain CCMP716" /LENGTH=87 /DNA_ID=CAMNT_0013398753 /DNA_START=135 /DNA_END=398 /DNA_ORIENTATION=-